MLKVVNILHWYKTRLSFCVRNEPFWRWRRAHSPSRMRRLALGANATLKTNEANMFGAGNEITHLALKTNAFSAKDGTCLTLKANVFGASDKLNRLVIETNAFGTGDERVWHTNPKPKIEQPSSFLVQIFGNTYLQLVSSQTGKQAEPNASNFSTCTRLEYFCTSLRIYDKYNHIHPKSIQEFRQLRSVGPPETRNIFGVAYPKNFFNT